MSGAGRHAYSAVPGAVCKHFLRLFCSAPDVAGTACFACRKQVLDLLLSQSSGSALPSAPDAEAVELLWEECGISEGQHLTRAAWERFMLQVSTASFLALYAAAGIRHHTCSCQDAASTWLCCRQHHAVLFLQTHGVTAVSLAMPPVCACAAVHPPQCGARCQLVHCQCDHTSTVLPPTQAPDQLATQEATHSVHTQVSNCLAGHTCSTAV